MIRLVISGCYGKMGKRINALASADKEFKIAGAIEVGDNPEVIKEADVLVEFTNPAATCEHLDLAVKYKKAAVIGTTGLEAQQVQKVKQASGNIPVLFSPNMSLGVNLVFRLVKEAAQKLGAGYKADIVEAHHVHKKDAPSGTAKRLADLIKQAPGREKEEVKIDSIREGEIVGEHQVSFESAQDTITIKHSAKTRDVFARGALEAAKFLIKQRPGLYDMQDVIESRKK